MEEEKEQLKKIVKNLQSYSDELATTIETTDETNTQGQKKYMSLTQLKSHVDSTLEFCITAQDNSDKINGEDINEIKFAADSVMQSSPTVTLVAKESKEVKVSVASHTSTINATMPIAASGTTWFYDFSEQRPDIFPNRDDIVKKYNVKTVLEDDISYIKSQLPIIKKYVPCCDISEEFKNFVRDFQSAPPSENKYQYLSSCRAMIFGRLIIRYQWGKFGKPKDHRESITNFITNGKKLDATDVDLVKKFLDLYEELSERNPKKPSIKKGRNITAQYNEQLFGKIIGYMDALLRLREKYAT